MWSKCLKESQVRTWKDLKELQIVNGFIWKNTKMINSMKANPSNNSQDIVTFTFKMPPNIVDVCLLLNFKKDRGEVIRIGSSIRWRWAIGPTMCFDGKRYWREMIVTKAEGDDKRTISVCAFVPLDLYIISITGDENASEESWS